MTHASLQHEDLCVIPQPENTLSLRAITPYRLRKDVTVFCLIGFAWLIRVSTIGDSVNRTPIPVEGIVSRQARIHLQSRNRTSREFQKDLPGGRRAMAGNAKRFNRRNT